MAVLRRRSSSGVAVAEVVPMTLARVERRLVVHPCPNRVHQLESHLVIEGSGASRWFRRVDPCQSRSQAMVVAPLRQGLRCWTLRLLCCALPTQGAVRMER